MLRVALLFLIPLAWYIGVKMGYRRGSKDGRLVVLRQLGRLKRRGQE